MARPLHVVWLNDRACPLGGAERYVLSTAPALRASGVRSTLLFDARSTVPAETARAFDGAFPVVNLPGQLRDLAPDVVYAHGLRTPGWLDGLAESAAPVVRFLHDHALLCLREAKITTVGHRTCTRPPGLACLACFGFVSRRARWPGVGLRSLGSLREEQRKNRTFARTVVGSRYMARQLQESGFDPDRVRVATLYAPMHADASDGGAERDPTRLLFVGTLTRGKGVDVLLDALVRLPAPVHLVVVGHGPQELELHAHAVALGLAPRVTFAGRADDAALAEHYRRAACLVLPSRAPETFGLVGVEAMSHGLPVVATALGGTAEWLEPERTGLAVPPDDPGALAVALARLLGDPARATALGRAGQDLWARRFRPEHHVARLVSIFEEVLS